MEIVTKRIIGFLTIHYSGDYLKEALLSVVNHVDKMVVAYSHLPSQSHSSQQVCPDLYTDIKRTCEEVLGEKLIWVEATSYPSEAHHRDVINRYTEGFDYILVCDCDEVMVNVQEALDYAEQHEEKYFGIKFYKNFFRSFSWFCADSFRPIRIIVINRHNQVQNLECPLEILHFSCAQRKEVMEYKYQNFGHASEIRPNYLENVFYKWTPTNDVKWLHPVSEQIWYEASTYNKELMPSYLKNHPNYNKYLI